jgi:RNA polymerase sigma-70 factor (ECF subfamily)
MVGEDVELEDAPVPRGNLSHSSDTVELAAATYEKLRRIAAEYLRSERAGHTLRPTALLHEAFLRVLKRPDHYWRSETHVIAFAARAMRRILISYGVARTRDKRGGPSVVRLPLDETLDFCAERETPIENFLVRSALQRPLDKLIIIYPEKCCATGIEESGILDIDKISRLLNSSCFILVLVILCFGQSSLSFQTLYWQRI